MASPALVAGYGHAAILTADGELLTLTAPAAADHLRRAPPPLLVHAPATFRRLGLRAPTQAFPTLAALDLLELFAFVLPARTAAPTPRGLALALDLPPPETLEDAAILLPDIADALLARLAAGRTLPINAHAAGIAARMGRAGWLWAPAITRALQDASQSTDGFRPWRRLPEWDEHAPTPPPSAHAIAPAQARSRLATLLGPHAEQRPSQGDYAHAAAAAFAPRETRGDPHMVLAEAGTGTGKTLGYIAPASLWAETNHGPVWISTFTRHLQRQIDSETARLHPDPAERHRRVVVRKGRENYLCLLNLEDATNNALNGPASASAGFIPLGLIARWVQATADGDLYGGDLPGWFAEMFSSALLASIADRRGECIHGACPHYRRCFIEHTIRRARTADLVIANHALVMTQAAWGGLDDDTIPTRYVFDEGHHVFEAADSAFSSEISGVEGAELRRWLLGVEDGRGRARGLKRRIHDLIVGEADLEPPFDAILQAARDLPAPGWSLRLQADPPDSNGNPFEAFLQAARRQILARLPGDDDPTRGATNEVDLFPLTEAISTAAPTLHRALGQLAQPLATLIKRMEKRLDEDAEELEPGTRERFDAAIRTLRRRALDRVTTWQSMLATLSEPRPQPGDRPDFISFLRLDRRPGPTNAQADRDIAYCRHHLDPTLPFAVTLAAPAHGLLITSATLRDATLSDTIPSDATLTEPAPDSDPEADWFAAEARVGANHLPSPAYRASVASPFDYAAQTRAFIVNDVTPDIAALATAYRTLFQAANGGALGLFTAIGRLRAVHAKIAQPLEEAGIQLLAQHIDPMDNATLVDIFRTEENACLLGTDAMRDGVDVPGRALRLVVFERVPWPRPDILHRERRIHLSGGDTSGYDDRIARLRLRQAFGRLIRTATDHGVFVLLDRRTPSRLLPAFPPGVVVTRTGLADAVAQTREFLTKESVRLGGQRPPKPLHS